MGKHSFIMFFKKIPVTFFLILLFLELGLRAEGFITSFLQEYKNNLSLKQKGAYRILCLGESTTRNQYPPILEKILNNSKIPAKFSVIDRGVVGTNSSFIVSGLEENIKKYRPHLAVVMMGIGDSQAHLEENIKKDSPDTVAAMLGTKNSLRIYKLAQILLIRIQNKIKESGFNKKQHAVLIRNNANEAGAGADISYLNLGKQLVAQGQTSLARKAFKKAIELNPDNADAYFRLCWLTEDSEEVDEIFSHTFRIFKKLIETDSFNTIGKLDDSTSNLTFFGTVFVDCCAGGYQEELKGLLKEILVRDPKNAEAHNILGYLFLKQGLYPEAEGFFKKAIELNDNDSKAFDYLAVLYHNTGRPDLSEQYLRQADKLRAQYYPLVTASNYKKIKAMLDAYKIKLVCVGYPMRSIESLKVIFEGKNDVIFVNNESIFKDSLKKSSYKELFSDMFAGDFGHCTEKGNRLLAGNIADTITREVFHR